MHGLRGVGNWNWGGVEGDGVGEIDPALARMGKERNGFYSAQVQVP
jgi:hypothetical protein